MSKPGIAAGALDLGAGFDCAKTRDTQNATISNDFEVDMYRSYSNLRGSSDRRFAQHRQVGKGVRFFFSM
jgi:hypothetical protein